MKLLLCCAVLCCALPVVVAANIAPPRYAPPREWSQLKFVIENDAHARPAELVLPREFDPSAAGAAGSQGLSAPETVVSGAALSLGLVFGGLWIARSRRGMSTRATRATTAAVVALCTIAGASVYALANAAPPRPVDPGTLLLAAPNGGPLQGQVRIHYGGERGVVKLVLPGPKAETSKHGE